MFKVAKNPTFIHDVAVSVPVDGGHEPQTLRTRFRVLTLDEITDIGGFTTLAGQRAFADRVVVDFFDLVDDAGHPLDCTPELRTTILSYPFVEVAVVRTYNAAMFEAATKN